MAGAKAEVAVRARDEADVWFSTPARNEHPTMKPTELVRRDSEQRPAGETVLTRSVAPVGSDRCERTGRRRLVESILRTSMWRCAEREAFTAERRRK
jgi:hypothetical protein